MKGIVNVTEHLSEIVKRGEKNLTKVSYLKLTVYIIKAEYSSGGLCVCITISIIT